MRGRIAMDSLIPAAAQALAAGDPLGALDRVALREDIPGLALRVSPWRNWAICCGPRHWYAGRRRPSGRKRP